MKRVMKSLAATALLLLSIAVLSGGDAWAYKRKSSVTGQGGRSVTQDVNANRTATGYQRSSTTTGPRDNSVQTQSSGNWDSNTNTWTKDKSVTGPGGTSKSWEKSTTVTK
ncbi:hypothetical protein NNJEOMEG_00086 [Fundidesulfovibrio magnetotacticus]|uniref:Uncharacterized protein n=1 Tax=Fundidesulfovibrio magnetotacticus TaxID=2730080 RepID=A0A6V8LKQ8_9BACT|nr:hypothetical protein [Fundidesulfovibrio magnetotacticus]GFK92264.1 hypothetical protein NNJEOMEG_00086 [Fundidesulfovibrio magnetotacticus]